MASMKEIAIGITQVLLHSREPEPLYVELWNESPDEVAMLVKAVLAECADANIALRLVRVPNRCWAFLFRDAASFLRPEATRIEPMAALDQRVEFWRREPPD